MRVRTTIHNNMERNKDKSKNRRKKDLFLLQVDPTWLRKY